MIGGWEAAFEEIAHPAAKERGLLVAIVSRAVADAMNETRMRSIGRGYTVDYEKSAMGWLTTLDEEPFSFIWICRELDWEYREVQGAILKLVKDRATRDMSKKRFSLKTKQMAFG